MRIERNDEIPHDRLEFTIRMRQFGSFWRHGASSNLGNTLPQKPDGPDVPPEKTAHHQQHENDGHKSPGQQKQGRAVSRRDCRLANRAGPGGGIVDEPFEAGDHVLVDIQDLGFLKNILRIQHRLKFRTEHE